ncbi:hypothetical protein [Pelagibacterium sp. H642]|uniref:hypothetical protein n=1 Tax=Pelagibacterium sp. H642 TaxID=1881069 RepID=UPI0028161315|nr:hypothetical protein [Pelagibacterium sp. H642]WMT89041.1 hypothetical protein NO934_09395 [Pelagibacterium sp. H642]
MFDLSFLQIVSRAIAIVIVLTVMGFSVATFARLLGDKGAVYDAKLTPNPFAHIDIFAFAAGIIARIGWVRPIAIDPAKCFGGRTAPVIVAAATLIVVFLLGRLALMLLPWIAVSWPSSSAAFADSTMRTLADTAAWTLAANLIPLPPFLGGYLLQAVAPRAHSWLVQRHLWISLALLVVVVLTYRMISSTALGDLARLFGAR